MLKNVTIKNCKIKNPRIKIVTVKKHLWFYYKIFKRFQTSNCWQHLQLNLYFPYERDSSQFFRFLEVHYLRLDVRNNCGYLPVGGIIKNFFNGLFSSKHITLESLLSPTPNLNFRLNCHLFAICLPDLKHDGHQE